MRARSFLALTVAVFLCSALPVGAQGEQEKQLQLPDGDGKAIVQNRCSACHGLNMLPNQFGSTAEQWQKVFSTMVALPGDQPTVVSNYLAKSFPVKGKPDAVIVPGNATVSIKEFLLPTSASGRTIRSRHRTATSGGRACSQTSSDGSIRRRVR